MDKQQFEICPIADDELDAVNGGTACLQGAAIASQVCGALGDVFQA